MSLTSDQQRIYNLLKGLKSGAIDAMEAMTVNRNTHDSLSNDEWEDIQTCEIDQLVRDITEIQQILKG